MDSYENLVEYYNKSSKHSNYQILPNVLRKILKTSDINTKSRAEEERLKYITKIIEIKNLAVLDVGGNTGYFTFELLDAGAKHVDYFDGNHVHSEFVRLSAEATGLSEKLTVTNEYFQFTKYEKKFDIALLLNVLHHVGDDYGGKILTIEDAKKEIIKQLNSMSAYVNILVFQLGFNWQGNSDKCLFEHGTKQEMIKFITEGTAGYWNVDNIGVAISADEGIEYINSSESNISRNDSLGEFLNRPIFILSSRKYINA